ncbi:MAG: hypothetical protein AB8F95_11775 [Bacteroidia bacterium]
MRNTLLFLLPLFILSCTAEPPGEKRKNGFIFSYEQDGKFVNDTIRATDKEMAVMDEMKKMMADPSYHTSGGNDTVFNRYENPVFVLFGTNTSGAEMARFEYDQQQRLVAISGYDRGGRTRAFDKNIAIKKYSYNSEGAVVIKNYGEDRKLISEGS